jgi:hypothetical protein
MDSWTFIFTNMDFPSETEQTKSTGKSKRSLLLTLTIRLGRVIALVDDEVLRPVVFAAGEVLVEDGLGAGSVTLYFISSLHHKSRHVD